MVDISGSSSARCRSYTIIARSNHYRSLEPKGKMRVDQPAPRADFAAMVRGIAQPAAPAGRPCLPFDEVPDAFAHFEAQRHFGKVHPLVSCCTAQPFAAIWDQSSPVCRFATACAPLSELNR
jgi:hypothetical protein